MNKSSLFGLFLVFVLLAACMNLPPSNLPPSPNSASFSAPLGKAIDPYSQGYAVPRTFNASYDYTKFNTTNNAVATTVAVNGEQYVYKIGYVYNGKFNEWSSFTFPEATVGSSKWISGNVSTSLQVTQDYLMNQTLLDETQPIYIVTYACTGLDDSWDCHNNEWMLQIINATIGNGCRVWASVVEDSIVNDRVSIGPFSHLRPGAQVGEKTHIGNFAEIKNSVLGEHVHVGHFSYLGDASVGDNVNIGAGTVTCNFDGKKKNPTEIGDGAFIGSDTLLVAPIRVGKGAKTGAGSVVTRDVPLGAVAVGMPARTLARRRSVAEPFSGDKER